jgi:hypothetical protein
MFNNRGAWARKRSFLAEIDCFCVVMLVRFFNGGIAPMPTFLIVTAKRNINRYTVVKKKGDS